MILAATVGRETLSPGRKILKILTRATAPRVRFLRDGDRICGPTRRVKTLAAGLGNFPAHAPSSRFEDKRTVFTIAEQALFHALLQLSAAFDGE